LLADSFRQAAESGDHGKLVGALAEDVVFRSPIVFKPYEGRDAVAPILAAVFTVFEDFRYVDQLEGENSATLLFKARVGDRELDGLDYLRFGEDGLVSELTVMVRPLSAANALAETMRARLEALAAGA
jgi:SnoaL-like domain